MFSTAVNYIMSLIPGLNDDVALRCLMYLPYDKLDNLKNVSPQWKYAIEHPLFHKYRRALGLTQPAIVVVQQWEDSSTKDFCSNFDDVFSLALFTQETGCWSYLPPLPGYPKGIPPFSSVVGVGMELVVLSGCDPEDYGINLDSVFVFNFLSGEWRIGMNMPNRGQIMDFGCCSDFENTVYIVGGRDDYWKKSRSVMAYDVAGDRWRLLPDMSKERMRCEVMFNQGKLKIIHEYNKYYGTAKTDIEILDVNTAQWDSCVTNDGVCEGSYPEGREKGLYKCCSRSQKIYKNVSGKWQVLTGLPDKVKYIHFSTIWGNKLLVLCSFEYENSVQCYTVDLVSFIWRKLDAVPEECTESIFSGCYLEI